MLPTLSPQKFVAKWRRVSLKERSASQSHFNDLCRLLGEPTPIEADPNGTWYTFEAGASKSGGGEGFADVWKKGYFAWEYKGKHADLDKAYQQLLKYRESLRNPPLLVVSDMDQIIVHTNFTNTVKREIVLTLDDLLDPARLDVLRAVFQHPRRLESPISPAQVTQQAATHFTRLADTLRKYDEEPEAIAHFLIRLLFCLFAEDIRLLPEDIFTKLVRTTKDRPKVFSQQLSELFSSMSTGGMFALEDIAEFDGGLFEGNEVLELDTEALDILADVCELDWGSIEPAILGTLFERSLDPSKRAQLGAHYTSREDILLIVEPVLMAPLRRRRAQVREEAIALAAKRDSAKSRRSRNGYENKLREALIGFAREISEVQVLDPACGSGNFLYVALRQLLDLWKEVSSLAYQLGLPALVPLEGSAPHPSQLHGIEINPYAHQLAQTAIWIGYLQWLHENGFGVPGEPILKPLEAVLQMDAILAYDGLGKPVEPKWPEAEVIVSNPPFLGSHKLRTELGDEYVEALFRLYEGRVPGAADLVCYWFEKARAAIDGGTAKRAGLLATQAIRGGANREVLKRIKRTGGIFWAQSDRDWILEGAAVHVSMVGFDDGSQRVRTLDGLAAETIHSDLTGGVNVSCALKLTENQCICFRSDEKGGPFDISADAALVMLEAPLNPNGRPNSDVVRPYLNARDITQRPRDVWIIDFGCDTSLEEAAQYEMPFEYAKRVVKPARDRVRNARERKYWWLHRRPAPDMRTAVAELSRFIVTPRVAKHRLFVWLDSETIPDCAVYAFAREDDYFFCILHSKCHELWALSLCTHLETRPRYTPTTTFETFPFPWPPGQEPLDDPRVQTIAEAAHELVGKRDAWLNPEGATEKELKKRTLTNLYNQRPTWLELAHRKLDEAVFDAYGWPHNLEDEEILARLLELNLERAAGATCGQAAG